MNRVKSSLSNQGNIHISIKKGLREYFLFQEYEQDFQK